MCDLCGFVNISRKSARAHSKKCRRTFQKVQAHIPKSARAHSKKCRRTFQKVQAHIPESARAHFTKCKHTFQKVHAHIWNSARAHLEAGVHRKVQTGTQHCVIGDQPQHSKWPQISLRSKVLQTVPQAQLGLPLQWCVLFRWFGFRSSVLELDLTLCTM